MFNRVGVTSLLLSLALLAGCPQPTPLAEGRLVHDDRERTFQYYVPRSYNAANAVPLLLAFHGFTQTGRLMAHMTGFSEIAEREGFIVVYPDGLLHRFNVFPDQKPDDFGFALALVDEFRQEYAVDPRRIYLTGASNGGFLAYRLACEAGDTFAGVAPVMSAMIRETAETCSDGEPMPVLIIHGTEDPIIPIDEDAIYAGPGRELQVLTTSETVEFWASRNGCSGPAYVEELPNIVPHDGTRVERHEFACAEDGADVVFYRVIGGGHNWPGARPRLPVWLVGEQSDDIDASEVIWQFLSSHP